MIPICKNYLKQVLQAVGISSVYTEPEDESRIKGPVYARLTHFEPERFEKDGTRIAKPSDIEKGSSDYYVREYKITVRIAVQLEARQEAQVGLLKKDFLNSLVPSFTDAEGFEVEIKPVNATPITDKSVLKIGAGYEVIVEFFGGVYQPLPTVEIVTSDPWVDAVAIWTQNLLGSDWNVYRHVWPYNYGHRSVLWRFVDISVDPFNQASFKVKKRMVAHVLGTVNEKNWCALRVVEGLQMDIKIPLDIDTRRYLTVNDPAANLRADPITNGQISVAFSRFVMKPSDEVPLINKIKTKGIILPG